MIDHRASSEVRRAHWEHSDGIEQPPAADRRALVGTEVYRHRASCCSAGDTRRLRRRFIEKASRLPRHRKPGSGIARGSEPRPAVLKRAAAPVRMLFPDIYERVKDPTFPARSSFNKMTEGLKGVDAVTNDLGDGEHRGCKDGTRYAPHPVPEHQRYDNEHRVDGKSTSK